MASEKSEQPHLEREYLPIRAKILEIAAALDRIQRASPKAVADPRWGQLQTGIVRLQSVFSRPYEEQWRETIGLSR